MSAEDLTNLLSNLFNERNGREVEVDEDQEEGLVASEEDEAAKAMDNEVEAATAEVEVRETDPAEILKFNSYVDAVLRRMNAGIRAKRMDPMVINLGGKKKKHADSKKHKGHRTKRALTIPMNFDELEDEDDEMVAVEEEDEEGRSLKEDEDQEEGRKKKNRKNGKGKKKEAEDEDEDEEVDEVEGRAKKGKKNRKNKNKKSKLTAEQKAAKAAKKANKKSAKKDARKGDKKKKNNAGKKGTKKNHNNKKENNNKVAATRAAKQHHNNHKNNKGKSKSSKSSSSSNSGLGEGKVHGSLSGIATLRRAGDVEIYNIGSDQKKLKTEFTVGPLQLQVSKTHGHGSSRSEKTAKATTQNLEGKMVIKVKADGKAFVKSVFFKPPEKVNVKGSLVPQRARSDAFLKRSINLVRPLAAQRLLKIARFTMKTPATTRA